MKKGNWWLRLPAYFQYEDIFKGDKDRGDAEDSLVKEQFVSEETTTQTIMSSLGSIPPQKNKYIFKLYRPEGQIDSERILCLYRLEIDKKGEILPVEERLARFGNYYQINYLNIISYHQQQMVPHIWVSKRVLKILFKN